MKFEELPETPRIWIDFMRSKLSFLPAPCEIHMPCARMDAIGDRGMMRERFFGALTDGAALDSARTVESVRRLRQPETVVVITNFYPSLFGGPIFQILKCLTAIKVCGELAKCEIEAVPVCWISAAPALNFSKSSIGLLDHESEFHCLQIQRCEPADFTPGEPLPFSQVAELLAQIERLGRGAFDDEVLEILKTTFAPETTFSSASADLVADLMREWGTIVLNADAPAFEPILIEALAPIRSQIERVRSILQKQTSELAAAGYAGGSSESDIATSLVQGLVMPVIAYVIDPYEVYSYARAMPVFDDVGLPRPIIWPQSSATIVDARSRRILERYNLDIRQLYSGEEEIIKRIRDTMSNSALGKLDGLEREVETRVDKLGTWVSAGNEFAAAADSCKKKMVYQLEKLRHRFNAAVIRKEQTLRRRIHRVCNSLAPNRNVQERELAGILVPLRYSRAGLRSLYEKLDIGKLEHQLIPMD